MTNRLLASKVYRARERSYGNRLGVKARLRATKPRELEEDYIWALRPQAASCKILGAAS